MLYIHCHCLLLSDTNAGCDCMLKCVCVCNAAYNAIAGIKMNLQIVVCDSVGLGFYFLVSCLSSSDLS